MTTSYRPIAPITASNYPQPLTALSFDPVSDTLWVGSNSGSIVAYHGTRGLHGVSFPVGGQLAVSKILAGENYVRAMGVSGEGLGSWSKGGVNKWFCRPPPTLTTFSNTSMASSVLAASSTGSELLLLNSMTGAILRQVSTPSLITHLEFSHSAILSGASDGYVRTHDPRTALHRPESQIMAHYSGIQGLQTTGNFVFTIGLGVTRRQARPFPDPLVKVYDLRTMRPLPPIPFSSTPAFINILPKRPSTIVVTSNQGLINIVDVSTAGSEFYQLDITSYLTSVAISPTGAYLACGDAEGIVHLMTQIDEEGSLPFNGFDGQPVEWADTPAPLPQIEWTDTTPLNSIGLPYYESRLLSSWTPLFVSTPANYPPPAKIPPQPDPDTPTWEYNDSTIPRMYRKVEIEYSKFGVEDFDFGQVYPAIYNVIIHRSLNSFYNKTEYSGLETHILNSYTNALVQIMHYSPSIQRLAKSHITTSCPREHCLLCELGFVVRMLEDANGTNCQASNFCKTVGVLAQSSNAIELIDYGRESTKVDYALMIQSFHRFLLDHLSSEGNAFPHNPLILNIPTLDQASTNLPAAPVTQLLGVDAKNLITCMNCKTVREKENMTHVIDLTYPRPATNDPLPLEFTAVLRNALLRHMTHKATCSSCKHFSNFSSRRSIASRDLPPILAINASVYSAESLGYWLDNKNQRFLKPQIELHGQVEGVDDPEGVVYSLRSFVVQIMNKEKSSHLVAIIKVPEAEGRTDLTSPWFIFNDFAVQNITEAEALSFPGSWKVRQRFPDLMRFLTLFVRDQPSSITSALIDMMPLTSAVCLPRWILRFFATILPSPCMYLHLSSLATADLWYSNRDPNRIKHECLSFEELPKPGMLVAIDAEFVSMQQEETEFRSDGSKQVLRPARLSLARVSVLRGDGPKQGVPFIDDHIHTSEVIVDYLTEFSGIRFGDLDPALSPHTLTPLKLVYKKLRLLVDRGCIFIGHGLSKDFRIINIFVPPEQVIDTVDLYFLKARQRRLALRFLSWFVLGENIQTDTHDSIEDARSALNLYKAYHDFEEQGIFDQKLEELYKEGRQYNFKPPPPPDSGSATAIPPSESTVTNQLAFFSLDGGNAMNPQMYPMSQSGTPLGTPSPSRNMNWRRER
ncbi:PAN2-PAN3 deadenylation complex catalytic subunit PAN2 [Mycena sanguinolenta]|uniref:PAN2-PAN3 deadenylation complex catalytic subunit PAN2 n=1 Tax=Mycena sanguinolenta TaxID=230812 RepID=A0A8H6YHV1_9AGAR|nr:PAN2-PAN3 deadenylation complex catalytic subunit PAN2 [Mycena sanguinolenta]